MDRLQTTLAPALGRVLMAIIFIVAGWGKLTAPGATIGYIGSVGLPAPTLAYIVALVVELGGGLLLLAGYGTRWVALVLFVFCIVTGFAVHLPVGDMNNRIHFMKNLAMAGGFLYVAAFGAGAWSVDASLAARRGTPRIA